jgi:hypothetical protein
LACLEQYTLRRASRLVSLRDADAKHLLCQDVVHASLASPASAGQALGEAAGDLAQEHAGFGERVQKPDVRVLPTWLAPPWSFAHA